MMNVRKGLGGHASGVALKGLVVASAMTFASPIFAQSNVDGSIYGSAPTGAEQVVIEGNGQTFTLTPDSDGKFRAASVPVGQYTVTVKRAGAPDVSKQVLVRIGTGTNVIFAEGDTTGSADLGTLQVVGASVSPIDISSVETAVNFSDIQLAEMPIARDLTSVALLAPGTVSGDSAFGNLASFGGSSVAENAYYFNGFNITNFRTGLGYSNIPFEFFSDFQIKTSGYGAEFGRSTGGVVSATSKRGTNEFKLSANAYWEPKSLGEKSPDSFYYDDDGNKVYLRDNSKDELERRTVNLSASGAIIKDRLFFYALYQYRDVEQKFISGGTDFSRERDNPFYALKLDGVIAPGHNLEFTYFRNDDEIYDYSNTAPVVYDLGGDTLIGRYTGQITDYLQVSALYGKGELNDNQTVDGIYAYDRNTGSFVGTATASLSDNNFDEREAFRIDATLDLGDHSIKLGYDNEDLTVGNDDGVVGDSVVDVNFVDANGNGQPDEMTMPQRYVYALNYDFVQLDNYLNGGNFETISSALYLEDTWRINDRMTAYVGLRNETFDNKNADGESFIKIDDQLAPRLGFAYDVLGGGKSKLYVNYGRYYLPVATNTNLRLAGAETYYRGLYAIDVDNPYDANGVPNIIDPDPLDYAVYSNGDVAPTDSSVDKNIEPQYQDEYVIGYQMDFGNRWQGGISFIRRDLKSTLEDVAVDAALQKYSDENGGNLELGGFDYYVLTNPGNDIEISVDIDGDGTLDPLTLSAEDLGYPKGERYYNAVELTFERIFDGKWSLQGSYTWSQSYGNVEGGVRSDNGQTDTGLTTGFDQPGLVDGSYGYLPNDRRHKLKLFGSYRALPEVIVGANLRVNSGRPINAFGNHPTDDFAAAYGSESFYSFGNLNPRASRGRTSWTYNLDLSARYQPNAVRGLTLGVDVFNVFDFDKETEVYEIEEEDFNPGVADPNYKLPTEYQDPRYVRFSVEYDFTF